jgi:hypothetical protein
MVSRSIACSKGSWTAAEALTAGHGGIPLLVGRSFLVLRELSPPPHSRGTHESTRFPWGRIVRWTFQIQSIYITPPYLVNWQRARRTALPQLRGRGGLRESLLTELAGKASISTTTRATLMHQSALENNRPSEHQHSIVLIRHGTVLSPHAVINTMVVLARAS